MPQEWLFCLLVGFAKLYLIVDAKINPEYGYWTADLHVGETVIVDNDDLLSLTEICHMAFWVKTTGNVTNAAFFDRATGEQEVFDLLAFVN